MQQQHWFLVHLDKHILHQYYMSASTGCDVPSRYNINFAWSFSRCSTAWLLSTWPSCALQSLLVRNVWRWDQYWLCMDCWTFLDEHQIQTSATMLLELKDLRPGTVCLIKLQQLWPSSSSRVNYRHICLPSLIHNVECSWGVVFTPWLYINHPNHHHHQSQFTVIAQIIRTCFFNYFCICQN